MPNHYLLLYLCIVGLAGILLIWWSRRKISRVEGQRSSRVKKLRRFESIETTTPLDSPAQKAKDAAVESIGNRFTIIRKISFFSIVTFWLIALLLPFLNTLPAALVSILVAASGIIIGIAARPFIENLISGMVITFSHPIRIGDTVVIDGNYGTVEDITITHTVVKIWNWRRYIIPNSQMLSKEIINCTINDTYQLAHVEFFVAYDSDIGLLKKLATEAAIKSRHFADYEDPRFWVMEMGERGFKCWVAAWADSPADAWELGNDVRTELISKFRIHGVSCHRLAVAFPEGDPSPSLQA
jgi:small-conductance mechanosensitive channel